MRAGALLLTVLTLLPAGLRAQAQPLTIKPSAQQQIGAIVGIKTAKSAVQKKIDSRLYMGLLHQRNDARLASLTAFRFVKPEADGRIAVDIVLSSVNAMKPVLNEVMALGGDVKAKSSRYLAVRARVHLEDLETLAGIAGVRRVRQAVTALNEKINTSEGDKTHGADEARDFFGTDGTGVKVCVLSDGVDSLTSLEASGDLPASVDVLPGQNGSGDEGSAMLEIVHDLAPGATLGFATADTSESQFAQNILDLATSGCKIIVDDVIYLDESPFEDGPVAQSVNTVTAAGVLYFSSAGNEGNVDDGTSGTWEGDFNPNGNLDPVLGDGAGTVHNFGDGGQSLSVTGAGGNSAALIWAEHYDLNTGNASTDFDLYDLDDSLSMVFDMSTNTQDGSGGDDFPVEIIPNDVFSGDRMVIAEFAAGTTSSTPMFNLIVFRGVVDPNLATSGATRGHSTSASAFSLAATPAVASFDGISPDGPFPGLFTAANQSEDFTSDGPRRIILDGLTGNELTPGNRTSTGGVVRQKPDFTAADGVSCAAPGFAPFYGTSAAAPHAAAIAALLKSNMPGLTQAQIRTALTASAIDIENPGVDRDTGAGIIMAHAALAAVGATPRAFLAAGTPVKTQVSGDGDAFVEPNETWSLTIPLSNTGGASATGIVGTLTTSTPGITILTGTSAYPDLTVGARPAATAQKGALPTKGGAGSAGPANNVTPYVFRVTSGAACGEIIQFTLTVTYSGGSSPQTFPFTIQTGAPGTPVTFSYTGPVVPIPDSTGADVGGTPAFASLPVSGLIGDIYDLNFSIDGATCTATTGATTVGLDHSFVNDLQLTLIGPDSTSVLVVNRTDGGGNNFCQTVLDDQSAGGSIQAVASAQAPFTGSFTPNSALAAFQGISGNGTWQLEAQDFFVGDSGNIRAFSVIVTPAVCDAVATGAVITATKAVTGGSQQPGGTVIYTVTLNNTGTAAQADDAGNEFTDTVPSPLVVGTPTASAGTVSAAGVNPVTWNGAIPIGGTVTITIPATIPTGTAGQTISNQGTVNYDSDNDGINDATTQTDAPGGTANDPTTFVVGAGPIAEVPTLSDFGLALLALMMAGAAVLALRRRRQSTGA
ncbi:MAG TPA: IPTL-CTERM sorting domain-containing protein [Thermoanaerobaculia bacterium]|nr:IPTL-CTERM sorting domain-containing protein [Thermoanaerobaculia bacterium]